MTIHLERPLPGASRDLPGRLGWKHPWARRPAPSLFGLAPGGVCPAAAVAGGAVRSCRTISPLRRGKPRSRYLFCGTVPGVAPAGRYPAPCFHGARTFLPRALSGLAAAVIRPAGGMTGRRWAGRGQMLVWRGWSQQGCNRFRRRDMRARLRGGSGRLRGGFPLRAERVARALPSAGIEWLWSKAPVQRPRPAGSCQNARRFETGIACRPVALRRRGRNAPGALRSVPGSLGYVFPNPQARRSIPIRGRRRDQDPKRGER